MKKKSIFLISLSVFVITALLTGCASMMAKPTQKGFREPVITLNHVEVQKYWGWWYFSGKVKPTKGNAGNYGAPMVLAFIFDIQNPNKFSVMMEEMKFTVGFEEFDLDTVILPDEVWVPAGKTTQVRALSIFDGRSALLSLLVTGGYKLKARGWSPWKALEKYWTGIPDFSFPVHVNQGSAIFKAGDIVKGVSFKATFP